MQETNKIQRNKSFKNEILRILEFMRNRFQFNCANCEAEFAAVLHPAKYRSSPLSTQWTASVMVLYRDHATACDTTEYGYIRTCWEPTTNFMTFETCIVNK
jgi:hypothetical protein